MMMTPGLPWTRDYTAHPTHGFELHNTLILGITIAMVIGRASQVMRGFAKVASLGPCLP